MTPAPLRNAILEIGTEEIPARFIPGSLLQLESLIKGELAKARVKFEKIEVWGTPRRLVASIQGLPPRSDDRTELVIGPPPQVAKNEKGEWSPAALGFAKTQKVPLEKLLLQTTPKGERYVVVHERKGQKTDLVLKDLFPAVIQSLSFPKSMVWETSGFRFARPLRWILALYNSQVIRFKLAGLQSDRSTYGLSALGGKKISIPKADKFKSLLQGRCIIVDSELRKKNIQNQMEIIGKRLASQVLVFSENLQDVVFLTEHPVSIVGHFKESFLKLPREVLISSLIKHQKFFPVETHKGQLTHAFIGVRNGLSESQETVRDGYERVINARLADAKFFFEHDSKIKLEELVPRLKGVGFVEKMGSLFDKTERVGRLTQDIGQHIKLAESKLNVAARIAFLAKADLLTQMVGEFPEIQGVAGRFYSALHEPESVSFGIEQHYWPLTAEGPLPKLEEAALVSIADKLDTLAAHFSAGQIPTGSADPNGLRRLGAGVIRILLDRKWDLTLVDLAQKTCSQLPLDNSAQKKVVSNLIDFLNQRASNWFSHQGFRSDEIEAVISNPQDSLSTIYEKLTGLKNVRGRPEFEFLAAAIKRARNILRQAQERGVLPSSSILNTNGFQTETEQSLFNSLNMIRPVVISALDQKNFYEALLALAPLKTPVDTFFEAVMVMDENETVRNQRLCLLMSVKELFDSLADFSKLQGSVSA